MASRCFFSSDLLEEKQTGGKLERRREGEKERGGFTATATRLPWPRGDSGPKILVTWVIRSVKVIEGRFYDFRERNKKPGTEGEKDRERDRQNRVGARQRES